MDTEQILEKIYHRFKLKNYTERRAPLVNQMDSLLETEVNCFSCNGKCCTYVANSVQVDPIQTLELLSFLINQGRWNDALINNLKENIKEFRLDNELALSRGKILRRYYTCPFFVGGAKGCSIDPSSKPYGCLGFNPSLKAAKEGDGCGSDKELLTKREDLFSDSENHANEFLREKLNLYWEKKPIPTALLEVYEKLSNNSIQDSDF